MAYIGMVSYDEGGRVQTLQGTMDAFYDSGRTRNLLGANLEAVSYDNGGRFRSLYGLNLGQDDGLEDLPLTSPSSFIPIENMAPSIAPPSPVVDTTPTEITGSLVPPSGPTSMPVFYQPLVNVDAQSTPVTGNLTPPPASAALPAPQVQTLNVASALTSIFAGVKNIFSSTGATVKPVTAGTVVGTVPPTSWLSQGTMVTGLPNWGVLAGITIGGIVFISLMGKSSGGTGRKRNPRRRRNGMELVLMGANPRISYRRTGLERELAKLSRSAQKKGQAIRAAEYRQAARGGYR